MPGQSAPGGSGPRETGIRIEQILDEFRAAGRPDITEKVEELVGRLVELYGTGLERVVEMITDEPDGDARLRRLVDDDLVASLFVVHELHPEDTHARVHAALEKVRPYLGSHAGGVEFLGVDDEGVVALRLQGSCDGCPSSLVTVKMAIERAIEEAAPEVIRVEVEGVTDQPAKPKPSGPALLELAPPPPRRTAAEWDGAQWDGAEWADVDGLPALADGQLATFEVDGVAVLACRVGESLYAYRDHCPGCTGRLAGATLDGELLGCPRCDRRYDVRLAGRGTDGDTRLEPLPLLDTGGTGGTVQIAVPAGVPG